MASSVRKQITNRVMGWITMVIQVASERLRAVQRIAITPQKKQRTRCVLRAGAK